MQIYHIGKVFTKRESKLIVLVGSHVIHYAHWEYTDEPSLNAVKNVDGRDHLTPLHLASQQNSEEVLEWNWILSCFDASS